MKKMLVAVICLIMFINVCACGNNDNKVVIYSSAESFRNDYMTERLQEKFPDYNIILDYIPTGDNGVRLKAEGLDTQADIIIALDMSYLNELTEYLADLSALYDFSIYLDELVPEQKTYIPWERWSGAILIDKAALSERDLPVPASYQDLLDPAYKGLISMPDPRSSGTGYFFLYLLVNAWGEDEAFEYFKSLSNNILQFTTSGSGPVRAIIAGEAVIGLGMTFQAVTERNNGAEFDIVYYEEGAPFGASGSAMIKDREKKSAVKEVFDFIVNELLIEDKDLFSPELIMKNQTIKVENYPIVPYANMEGYFNNDTRERLLDRWGS